MFLPFDPKLKGIAGTRKNRIGEAVLMCTHNYCLDQKN